MTDARDGLVARVSANLAAVRSRIADAGVDPAAVSVVAVTKTFGEAAVRAAAEAGLSDVAESYANELVATHDAAGLDGLTGLTWHYLGALQRNKLSRLAPRVDVYQAVTSARDAVALAGRAPGARCYLEVNVAQDPGRPGCAPGELDAVLLAARSAGLAVEGLMCVASPDRDRAKGQFAALRRLADDRGLAGCSMGMSGDYDLACAAGSTMVRLGTALFGERQGSRSGIPPSMARATTRGSR